MAFNDYPKLSTEEQAVLLQELKRKSSPEEWASLTLLARIVASNPAEQKQDDMVQTLAKIIPTLLSILSTLIREAANGDTTISLADFIRSGKFSELLAQTTAILAKTEKFDDLLEQTAAQFADTDKEQWPFLSEQGKESLPDGEPADALPRLLSIIPTKHLIPNNKLANSLTRDIIGFGPVDLIVSGRGKNEIKTRCILNYDSNDVQISSRLPFTEYDRNVADAVASLYEYGDSSHIVTAATVYRAMVNARETETPSPQQIEAVTRSLDKMRFIRVQIDCTEELKRRKLHLNGSQITGGKIDTYLLTMDKLEVLAGGQKVSAYKVIRAPILYDYSRLTGQVLTVPSALLDIRDNTGARVADTELRIATKGYLMRRISVMKGKTNQSRSILYQTVYAEVCPNRTLNRVEQKRLRDYIALVLAHWITQDFIQGYTEIISGRQKTGIEIEL